MLPIYKGFSLRASRVSQEITDGAQIMGDSMLSKGFSIMYYTAYSPMYHLLVDPALQYSIQRSKHYKQYYPSNNVLCCSL